MHEHEPEGDPGCFWTFVRDQDPVVHSFANRPHHSPEEHRAWLLGMACGRLDAVWALALLHDDRGITDLERALDLYFAGLKSMLRGRSPRDFHEALERARAETDERNAGGPS